MKKKTVGTCSLSKWRSEKREGGIKLVKSSFRDNLLTHTSARVYINMYIGDELKGGLGECKDSWGSD